MEEQEARGGTGAAGLAGLAEPQSAENTLCGHAAELAPFVWGFVKHYPKNAMVQPARCEA